MVDVLVIGDTGSILEDHVEDISGQSEFETTVTQSLSHDETRVHQLQPTTDSAPFVGDGDDEMTGTCSPVADCNTALQNTCATCPQGSATKCEWKWITGVMAPLTTCGGEQTTAVNSSLGACECKQGTA